MNLIYKNLSTIIILILVGLLILQRACTDTSDPITDINDTTITIDKDEYWLLKHKKDTFWKTETFYVKGDPIPGKTIYKEVPADVDTAAILADYFAIRPYSETVFIKPDTISYGTVTVTDSVHQNKLFGRKYNFDLTIPEYVNTIVVKEKPKTQVYIGGGLGFNSQTFINNAYAGFLLKNKKDHIYGLNIGLSVAGDNQVTPFIGGSIYWKIRFKKQTTQYTKMGVDAAQLIINNMD